MKQDKVYTDYLQDIRTSIEEAEDFVSGLSFGEFIQDKKTINAVVRSLEVMGEAAKNISEEIREKYPEIPWKLIAGMRDKLIHEYAGVDLETVWDTVKNDFAKLKPLLEKVLEESKHYEERP